MPSIHTVHPSPSLTASGSTTAAGAAAQTVLFSTDSVRWLLLLPSAPSPPPQHRCDRCSDFGFPCFLAFSTAVWPTAGSPSKGRPFRPSGWWVGGGETTDEIPYTKTNERTNEAGTQAGTQAGRQANHHKHAHVLCVNVEKYLCGSWLLVWLLRTRTHPLTRSITPLHEYYMAAMSVMIRTAILAP